MKADIYVELPSVSGALPRLARRRGDQLEPLKADGFVAQRRPKVVAFAPALAVAKFRVSVTARSEQEARKAALYAVEDDLAQPVEDVYLALGPRARASSIRDVYIVDRKLLNGWLEFLGAAHLSSAEIVPESSLQFPDRTVMDFGDRLLVNGAHGLVAADADWPEGAKLALIQASGLDGADIRAADALQTLAGLHAKSPGISIAVADNGPGGRNRSGGARSWQVAGVLALAAAAIWVGSIWMETNRVHAAASRQEAEARAQYRAQFPGAPEPADIHAEVRRLSRQLVPASDDGFRPLTLALYAAIAGSDTIRLVRLTYSQADRALHARLQFANRADEAAFKSRLEGAGLEVSTDAVRDLAAGIEADLIVRARP